MVIVALGRFVEDHDANAGIMGRHDAGAGVPMNVGGAIDGVSIERVNILRMIVANCCHIERQGQGDLSRLIFNIEIKFW